MASGSSGVTGLLTLLDPFEKHAHDPLVQLVAQDRVLDARVDARVVVDLDHHPPDI